MRLLFGTGNQAKLSAMKHRLEKMDIELIGLNDLRAEGYTIPEVPEDGETPLENADRKRLLILRYFRCRCFPVIQACILMMFQTKFSQGCMYVRYRGSIYLMRK